MTRCPGFAFGWALLAAREGHAQSAELTGVMYRNGIGVPQNFVKARKWLERALARGSNEPNFELAILYADDENPGVDKNKAANFLTEAIKTAEPRACLIAARNKIAEGVELRRTLGELNCAADGNIPEAMELLADYHLAKRSPLSKSRARAWLERAIRWQRHCRAKACCTGQPVTTPLVQWLNPKGIGFIFDPAITQHFGAAGSIMAAFFRVLPRRLPRFIRQCLCDAPRSRRGFCGAASRCRGCDTSSRLA